MMQDAGERGSESESEEDEEAARADGDSEEEARVVGDGEDDVDGFIERSSGSGSQSEGSYQN